MVRPKSSKAVAGKAGGKAGKQQRLVGSISKQVAGRPTKGGKPGAKGGPAVKQQNRQNQGTQSGQRGLKTGPHKDIYEAEDSDADEEKHPTHYDRLDNYEYEQPDTFEDDEEIDEDNAFTEEDKKKYAGWFGDNDGDDDGDGDGEEEKGEKEGSEEGDEDEKRGPAIDMLDSDDDDGEADKDVGDKDEDEDEVDDDKDAEEDEDAWLMDQLGGSGDEELDEDENDDEDADEDGDSAGGAAEAAGRGGRHILAAVVGEGGDNKRARRSEQVVVNEAYPESEFNLNPGAASAGAGASGELTVEELMRGLGDRKKQLGSTRKELERMAKKRAAPVATPLPRLIKERIERKAGYEQTAAEVSKWQAMIKANREAPTLRFTSARPEVSSLTSTAAIVSKHTPEEGMEAEVAELLRAAGAASDKAVQEAEEALSMKVLTVEEAKERRERLAKMRSLLFYNELKSKRLKLIKSKEFHRKAAKSEKRKGTKLVDGAAIEGGDADEDDQAMRDAAEEQEFERAKERLTLKHRNTSRWARRALKRGINVMDEGTKAAIQEQLQMGEALRRRIDGTDDRRGARMDDDDDDASTSASDSDGEEGVQRQKKAMSSRAKAAALDILSGASAPGLAGEELPKKGLFSLPFMARALEKQRINAQQEATQLLQELQEEEAASDGDVDGFGGAAPSAPAGSSGRGGRMSFGSGRANSAAAADDAADGFGSGSEEGGGSEDEDVDAKAERLGKLLADGGGTAPSAKALKQKGQAKQGGASRTFRPTEEDDADLDATLARGTTGFGDTSASLDVTVDVAGARALPNRGQAKSGSIFDSDAIVTAQRGSLFESKPASNEGGPSKASTSAPAPFIPSPTFKGSKPGYVFKKGPKGTGYYTDQATASSAAAAAATATKAGTAAGKKGAAVAGAGASLGGLHSKQQQHQQRRKGLGESGGGADDLVDQGAGDASAPSQAGNAADNEYDGADAGDDDDGGDDRVDGSGPVRGMVPMGVAGSKLSQQQIVGMAFAGDDVEAEFRKEKDADVAAELPKVEAPSTLPGWGMWSDQQREPRWMRDAKAKAQRERERAAAGRSDSKMKNVIISEKWDKKASKYTVQGVPFPYDSKDSYERSMRQPLGREYNADVAFRNLTRPAVLKSTGVMIQPIRFNKTVSKEVSARGGAGGASGISTIAGGMVKPAPRKEGKRKL